MKTQTIHTAATTLGPFLTLILLASPRRERATSGAQRPTSDDGLNSGRPYLATREEIFNESRPAPRAPVTLGPFLTLILSSRRCNTHGEGSEAAPGCGRERVAFALPQSSENCLGH